jgi:hypothetical protein
MSKYKILLVTRPNHDLTVRYLSAWGQKVIAEAKKKGIKVLELKDKRANKQELESMIKKHNPALIFLNGHGDKNSVAGQDDKNLVSLGDKNEEILSGSITYALACQSAKSLGVQATKDNFSAYIGYQEDFIFYLDQTKATRPLEDEVAKLFFEPSNQVVISLLKGNTASDANLNSRKFFARNIQKLLSSEASSESGQYIKYLWWNMKNQVCLGNGDYKF